MESILCLYAGCCSELDDDDVARLRKPLVRAARLAVGAYEKCGKPSGTDANVLAMAELKDVGDSVRLARLRTLGRVCKYGPPALVAFLAAAHSWRDLVVSNLQRLADHDEGIRKMASPSADPDAWLRLASSSSWSALVKKIDREAAAKGIWGREGPRFGRLSAAVSLGGSLDCQICGSAFSSLQNLAHTVSGRTKFGIPRRSLPVDPGALGARLSFGQGLALLNTSSTACVVQAGHAC